ncbi:integrating conjugative element protein [Azomonas macrocytogenes]|uniref:Integrating conjugative element protein (TIGR03755 family) n=1 Tax=Azomonas macrocytogenes TaxID=69962 RepID=A0A839TA60_AZOMA|nr:integrating conjugative element protein (TIGR03755 family) [Azomonas macrocytogenes]
MAVASLPALIIQRANPALYNLLTNGILQGRIDFDRSMLTCQNMSREMADWAGQQLGWSQIAQGQAMKTAIAAQGGGGTGGTNPVDAVNAVQQAQASRGNNGVPWVNGQNAGGENQEPIRVVSDVTKAGYNLMNGRAVGDTAAISAEDCAEGLVCTTWSSPDEAAAFAVRVLGEQEQQTCETCTKTRTTPGVGLTPLIQEAYEAKLLELTNLVNGNLNPTRENLQAVSTSAVPVTRRLVEALRTDEDQDVLTKRLASELALSSVIERALLLRRTLIAGTREPNVAANDLALSAVAKQNESLQQELDNLKTELELRRDLTGNASKMIIERSLERRESSKEIFEGDPIPDRIQHTEKSQITSE